MDIVRRVNWVDVLAVILMIRMSYVALHEGLSHEILPFIGSIVIIIIGLHYYSKIGSFISQNLVAVPIEISNFLSFLILSIIAGFIFKILTGFLNKIVKVAWHPFIEIFGGMVLGVVRAAIVVSLILMIIALAPVPYLQWSIRDKSVTGMYFLKIGPNIYARVSAFLPRIKIEGPPVDKEELIKNLASDKSIAPKARQEEKTAPVWENR